ncbi:hypothetical protein B0186_06320 [Canicola haemoglobinophilus]|uniref:Lipoprotein n=1 Tax=Canicola haemoglobinophilus TaxID=733 RepID=A0A1V4B130_9PAST|nr:YajG family lipoprotein [Canicola haemoglobinophilus]OOS00452.1 hypothetical protein B0186_06320 [Canicola haemoglobinophilus]STO59490.1 lipoprotein [Canicola haemoglobinophilus]
MTSYKKISFALLATNTLFLAACSSQSNTLRFTPLSPNSTFNAANQTSIVNVATRNTRNTQEISSYVRNGEMFKLYSSPDVAQLFDQIVKQDLNAKGFRIATTLAQANTNLTINVTDFYAQVDQGNLRYKITSRINLNVQVQGQKGQFSKNISASNVQEGAFGANNDEIQKVLKRTLDDMTKSIYQDQDISRAIHYYSN